MEYLTLYDLVNITFDCLIIDNWTTFKHTGVITDNESGKIIIIYINFRYNTVGFPVLIWDTVKDSILYHSEGNEYTKNYKIKKIETIKEGLNCESLLVGLSERLLDSYKKYK